MIAHESAHFDTAPLCRLDADIRELCKEGEARQKEDILQHDPSKRVKVKRHVTKADRGNCDKGHVESFEELLAKV